MIRLLAQPKRVNPGPRAVAEADVAIIHAGVSLLGSPNVLDRIGGER